MMYLERERESATLRVGAVFLPHRRIQLCTKYLYVVRNTSSGEGTCHITCVFYCIRYHNIVRGT